MKQISFIILSIVILLSGVKAQNAESSQNKKLYNPSADAKADLKQAIAEAASEGKHVFVQIGGNWCRWCVMFDNKVNSNDTLRTVMQKNYVVYHLNYSKENKNEEVLASLGYPQRFGFPVFVILDSKGDRLHTQNSVYLEEGEGHSTKKVMGFLTDWSPAALDPSKYNQ